MHTIAAPPRLSDVTAEFLRRQKARTYLRILAALTERRGLYSLPSVLREKWPDDPQLEFVERAVRQFHERAAVGAGTTSDPTFGSPLAPIKPWADAFVALATPQPLLDRIPFTRIPFLVGVPVETAPSVAGWVGETHPKAVGAMGFQTVYLAPAKASGTIVVTKELMRLATPASETALETDLATKIAAFLDRQLLDPTVAGVANVHPASLTNGVTAIIPSATTVKALVSDLATLIAQFLTNNPDVSTAALIMSPVYASMVALATNSLTLTAKGGTYAGIDVYPSTSAGTAIVLVDAARVVVADAGVQIDATEEATIQLDSAPDDPATAATVQVSLWQQNLVGLRAERIANWSRTRPTVVSYISPCAYVAGT